MNKKILAVALITALLSLASFYTFPGAVGTQVHIDGDDWTYISGSNPLGLNVIIQLNNIGKMIRR